MLGINFWFHLALPLSDCYDMIEQIWLNPKHYEIK